MVTYRKLTCLYRYVLIAILLINSSYVAISQSVDITLTTNYSSLPGLDASKVRMDNKMFATLILNDYSYKSYNVRLKMSIIGNGVSISSNNIFNNRKYTLVPGVPLTISSFDLGDYFDPESLDFFGIDKNAFFENGTLPEGNYRLCFEVVDGQSDGANKLSNTECDILPLLYKDVPKITSSISELLNDHTIRWSHDVMLTNEVNYTIEIYEYNGGKDYEIYTYQRPMVIIDAGSTNQYSVSKQLDKISKDKLYTLYVKAWNNAGFEHVFKNKGYSEPLHFGDFSKSAGCEGEITFTETTDVNGNPILTAHVEGCDQLFGGFRVNGLYSNSIPFTSNTGYAAYIVCQNDDGTLCEYEGTYGNENCIYGYECSIGNDCPGNLGYDCECIEKCIPTPITESRDSEGNLILTADLPAGCTDIVWSTGEQSVSITVPNPDAAYTFTAECNGCCYRGEYNNRSGCWPGRICSDGDPCTNNDRYDAFCNCIGDHMEGCDPDDPTTGCGGTLDISVTVDAAGGNYLTADLSDISADNCALGSIEYVWNNDYDMNQSFFYVQGGGTVTLLIQCDGGCSYTASIDLNDCLPGQPCEDDNDPTTIEYYDENCECVSYDCPDLDGDGEPDDCDTEQPCEGAVSIVTDWPNQQLYVDVQDVECDGNLTYLWATGATTASIPFLNENATYSVTVTCSSGCQYVAMSEGDNEDCIIGEICENDKSCNGFGTINENCECIPDNPESNFIAVYDVIEGEVSLAVELVDGECIGPDYLWSTGETSAEILINDLNGVYSVTVTCNNSCEFIAIYNYTGDECIINAPCNDGNPCTYNDTYNANCECEGNYALDENEQPITGPCEENPCNSFIACDDGDPCTYFDQIQCDPLNPNGIDDENYQPECAGVYLTDEDGNDIIDCDDDPCIIGAPCSDNNVCTINDTFDENCDCVGEQLFEEDGVTPLTDCDEVNPCPQSLIIDVNNTANYNEVLLSAVSDCETDATYQWSNGSGASSIVVPTQSGSYTVVLTCGDCTITATYNTNGCLIGLPCDDGLDCTTNDEVQEDCNCEGDPIEDLEITFEVNDVVENSCDYSGCLPTFDVYSEFTITSFEVILPSGLPFTLDQSMNGNGFDFPYCYNEISSSCLIQPSINVLLEDLESWLGEGSEVYIGAVQPGLSSCSGGPALRINNSVIDFNSMSGYNELNEILIFPFDMVGDCDESSPIGVHVTANIDCISLDDSGNVIPNDYLWSNGSNDQTVFIPIDENGDELYCLEVTIICANGCIYTETYGSNCEDCAEGVFGAPCDDGDPCTFGDTVEEDCKCIGLLLPDSDNDGECDEIDICPLGDDDIDLDGDGIPDACDDDVDCEQYLLGEITSSVSNDVVFYCMFLNDPIFTDETNTEDIFVKSLNVILEGVPTKLDVNSNGLGFHFPYLIDKASPVLLPPVFLEDLNGFFGSDGQSLGLTILPDALFGCFDWKENEDGSYTYYPQEGPNLFGGVELPSILDEMTFIWGGSNLFTKKFDVPVTEESYFNPYTLTANLTTECKGEPSYEWSTGSTESSINVPSLQATYTVTITCGTCDVIIKSTDETNENCVVGDVCSDFICNQTFYGNYDAFCNCIIENPPMDSDEDGIPDCDECEEEYAQFVEGETICCDEPPRLIYEEAEKVDVLNHCFKFDNDDKIWGIKINGIELNSSLNYSKDFGYDDGYFFHFPYCIESSCDYYPDGVGITTVDIPSTLKDYNRLAYDLQKWAVYHGMSFTTSTTYSDGFCLKCGDQGDILFINGWKLDEYADNNISVILDNNVDKSMHTCDAQIDGGYYVKFDNYDGSCLVTSITGKSNYGEEDINYNDPTGIDLKDFKVGPVPSQGVGFRLTITCGGNNDATGCIYEIVTPDPDCIVGDPCDSPNVCATDNYTGYNAIGCYCFEGTVNDIDEDGVCDEDDICSPPQGYTGGYDEQYDDTIDNDSDGIPDGCDDECGSVYCFIDIPFNNTSCSGKLNDFKIKLTKLGEFISLSNEEGFNFPYLTENENPPSSFNDFIIDLKYWLKKQESPYQQIYFDENGFKITGIKQFVAIDLINDCSEDNSGAAECLEAGCQFAVTTRIDPNRCPTLNDILIEKDGAIISIQELFPEVDFFGVCLYEQQGGFAPVVNCGNPDCTTIEEIEAMFNDLGIGLLNIKTEGLYVHITITDTDFEFVSAVVNPAFDQNSITANFTEEGCQHFCDDGWECTINDMWDENCNCVGTYVDSDNDYVCDAFDLCPGFPDYFDEDEDGIPDHCDPSVPVLCEPKNIPYCEYLASVLIQPTCWDNKMRQNNLILMNQILSIKLNNDPNALDYLPFPILKDQLKTQLSDPYLFDDDKDGIVDILDPAPNKATIEFPFGISHPLVGTHDFTDDETLQNAIFNCEGLDKDYNKERAMLLRMFMFTVNPGVLVGTNEDDSGDPVFSECINEVDASWKLDGSDYNSSGYIYSDKTKCYVYFELDCDCNCIVVESEAINLTEACEEITVGVECTQDPSLQNTEGFNFIQCPPVDSDPCAVFAVVSNPDYDPFNPEDGVEPCLCQQQMEENGDPVVMNDSDGDGVCDVLDQCAPAEEEDGTLILDESHPDFVPYDDSAGDSDGDGFNDCTDKCPNVAFGDENTLEGYATPTGPGDVCDDGNPCTYDDVITEDCKCEGVYIDLDDDGLYDCEECEYVVIGIEEYTVIINGEEVTKLKEVYAPSDDCGGCAGTVDVDANGNVVGPEDDPENIYQTLRGCDVCPGIPDGDPQDQDDYPMDYDNDGLPDCIDPPFKPICPDEFKIVPGVGIVLKFLTDNLDEGDYPEPIKFQATIASLGNLYQADYLTIDFVREVEEEGGNYTEIIYAHDAGDYITEDFNQAQIVYSDHQTCLLTADDFIPLPCPSNISIDNDFMVFDSESGSLDLSEVLGVFTLYDGENTLEIDASLEPPQFIGNQLYVDLVAYDLSEVFDSPFNGTITLPSGLDCTITGGTSQQCELEDGTMVTIGQPCDDGNVCTHHDKYYSDQNGDCVCIGQPNPDFDHDGFCDAIDPCPEDWNAMPVSGDVEDIDDCPCPALELSTVEGEEAGLQEGNDFYAYFTSDLSGYSDITIEIDNGQEDAYDPTNGNGVEAVSPIVIGNLTGGLTYTITITAYCDNGEPQIVSFEVDVPFGDSPILCGQELEPYDLSTFTYLINLETSETFTASDIEITVLRSKGSNGTFTGKGYIKLPYFNQARLNVTFNNIKISAERQMIDGYVDVNGFGVAILGDDISNAINNSLDNIIGVLEDISDVLDEVTKVLENIEELYNSTNEFIDEEIKKCIVKNTDILKERKAYLENNPNLSEAEIAQVKQDIELAAAALKECQAQYDAQMAGILNKLFNVYVKAFNDIQGECSSVDYVGDYNLVKELPNNILNTVKENLDVEVSGGTLTEEVQVEEEKITSFEVDGGSWDVNDTEMSEIADYFDKTMLYARCMFVNTVLSNEGGFSKDVSISLFKAFLSASIEIENELADELKSNKSPEEIYLDNKEKIDTLFSKFLSYSIYQTKK